MKKKYITLLLSLMLITILSIGVTFAYLTDEDSDKNTFTVGKVDITLDETDVDNTESGKENGITDEGRDKANTYHLLPGHSYVKDPQVTVLADSTDSYIRMIVNVTNMDQLKLAFPNDKYYAEENGKTVFLLENLVAGWDPQTWIYEGYEEVTDSGNNTTTGKYEFRYKNIVTQSSNITKLDELFESIVVPGEIDNAHIAYLENVEINVEAHAIQSTGFTDADAAWEAFSK